MERLTKQEKEAVLLAMEWIEKWDYEEPAGWPNSKNGYVFSCVALAHARTAVAGYKHSFLHRTPCSTEILNKYEEFFNMSEAICWFPTNETGKQQRLNALALFLAAEGVL